MHLTEVFVPTEGAVDVYGGIRLKARSGGRNATWLMLAVLGLLLTAIPVAPTVPATEQVIIRAQSSMLDTVRRNVESLGGVIVRDLSIIDGFSARIPANLDAGSLPGVTEVTPDGRIELSSARTGGGYTSMRTLTDRVLDVDRLWRQGVTGDGVGVALIDTGVTPVRGLGGSEKVVNGPDLSFDGGFDNLRWLDLHGHGTHLAGIIAGEDPRFSPNRRNTYAGVAPGAQIVNVKVADATGTADVSQVIAGIQWVVDHKDDGPVDIRVLTLAFGTDGTQDYRIDPLAHAAEAAWHAGIVVVVAAGNDGEDSALRNPATDPYVISVGALDPANTARTRDDRMLSFSNCGTSDRSVDILAPGKSIASFRVGGSYIDDQFPEARTGRRFFRGTGTSQAAAVVSGAAALLIDQRPDLTPDQVKDLLTRTATPVRGTDGACAGVGSLNIRRAAGARPQTVDQAWDVSDGSGSLEAARGSYHVTDGNGTILEGEIDVAGEPWTGGTWSGGTWSGVTWSGGTWNGGTWSGVTWSGVTWSGVSWSGVTWSGVTWSGVTWSGVSWSGVSWSGVSWSGVSWSGGTWSGSTWSGARWE